VTVEARRDRNSSRLVWRGLRLGSVPPALQPSELFDSSVEGLISPKEDVAVAKATLWSGEISDARRRKSQKLMGLAPGFEVRPVGSVGPDGVAPSSARVTLNTRLIPFTFLVFLGPSEKFQTGYRKQPFDAVALFAGYIAFFPDRVDEIGESPTV
jgi:hypothetical protein